MKWISDQRLDHLRTIVADPDFSSTKYTVIKELARGGMGTVYLAHDAELDRQVAIKVLNIADLNSDTRGRMIREARIIARLEHPGIVPVHDVGALPDDRIFYAMKFVRGSRLDEYIEEKPPLRDRLRKFQAACDAVAFAHAHNVIHRDLKPQNIMIGSFGEVLVLDWGIAKILPESTTNASEAETLKLPPQHIKDEADEIGDTVHGTIIGTRRYMSPEQARGEVKQLNARSDVYSLGGVLYFLLTNCAPSETNGEPTVSPKVLNPKITKAADAVCRKAMSLNPANRYTTAEELSADVGRLLDAEPVSAYRENLFEKAGRWVSKNRFLLLLVLAYLLMRIFFIFTSRR